MTIHDRVVKVIQKQLNARKEEIVAKAVITSDLGADSLDVVEMIMAFEEEFGVEIPDKDAEKMSTVGDVVKYMESLNSH